MQPGPKGIAEVSYLLTKERESEHCAEHYGADRKAEARGQTVRSYERLRSPEGGAGGGGKSSCKLGPLETSVNTQYKLIHTTLFFPTYNAFSSLKMSSQSLKCKKRQGKKLICDRLTSILLTLTVTIMTQMARKKKRKKSAYSQEECNLLII